MKNAIKVKEEGWNGSSLSLFRSLSFLDWLVVSAFLLSLSVMALTVYFSNNPNYIVTEYNPVTAALLSNPYLLAFPFGLGWAAIFTLYWKMRNNLGGVYIAFCLFSLLSFNFVNDITVVAMVVL